VDRCELLVSDACSVLISTLMFANGFGASPKCHCSVVIKFTLI